MVEISLRVVFERTGGVSSRELSRNPGNENIQRKDTHTMPKDNVIELKKPESAFIYDPITEVLRTGAKKLLAEALEAEIESFLSQYRELRDDQGRKRLVRNGYLPERNIQTGIGPVAVKVPRARDRHGRRSHERHRLRQALSSRRRVPARLRASTRRTRTYGPG